MSNNYEDMYYRYFIYSAEEAENLRKVHGNNIVLGTVNDRGVMKNYTSIVSNKDAIKSDGVVITKGDIRRIRYSPLQKKRQ